MSSLSVLESKSKSQSFLSWNDAHYCALRSQTNVYSLSKLVSNKDRINFLAASIDGHLTSIKFDYEPESEKQIPITNDDVLFDFAKLDTGSGKGEIEVVSINTVSNWNGTGTNILAVTYLKLCHFDEDKRPEAFMNIYKMLEGDTKVTYRNTAESLVQNIHLDFIPFKLTHHSVPVDDQWENLLLLSGNDFKIHTYFPIKDQKGYDEVVTAKYFPELAKIDDSVTQLEFKQLDDKYRLTSFGTQNGLVGLYLVNAESKDILDSWTSEMNSPITSLQFFQHNVNVKCPDFLNINDTINQSEPLEESDEFEESREEEEFNLLVTSALDLALVYEDVLANGLSKCRFLPLSNSQDVVLSSCVMDVDFDGENEVLIGTYGKVLLVYKLITEKPQVFSSTPFHSPMPVPIHTDTPILSGDEVKSGKLECSSQDHKEKDVRRRHRTVAGTSSCVENDTSSCFDQHDKQRSDDGPDILMQQAQMLRMVRSTENLASPSVRSIQFDTPERPETPEITFPQFAMTPGMELPCYKLMWTRRFCNPLMGLACDDVMGDGMLDLVVLTLKGMHILQPDLHEVATFVLNRLQQISDIKTSSKT